MKPYELIYLVDPEIQEEQLKTISQKINDSINQGGGILERENNPQKQKLAYPIKGKGVAFLIELYFHFDPQKLLGFENILKETPKILRYSIAIKKPREKLLKKPPRIKVLKSGETKTKTEKVELKEIEKKLEEILGQ